jgi:hypothetical protein
MEAQNLSGALEESASDPVETVAGRAFSESELQSCGAAAIAALRLAPRAVAIVSQIGVKTVAELGSVPLADLLQLRHCGFESI